MLLFLGLILEHLVPTNKRRMDRIDHLCLWAIRCSVVVLFLTLPHAMVLVDATSDDESGSSSSSSSTGTGSAVVASPEFFFACSGGKLDIVQTSIEEHPDWINARTENGEACLHLTGIYGHADVTSLLLERGADPNIRSTYAEGLRMHPLSWNVYGGHIDNIQLLLSHGADVNLDFDGMGSSGGTKNGSNSVTAMDVIAQLKVAEEGDDRFVKLEELLKQHGGMTRSEWLQKQEQPKGEGGEEL